MRRTARYYLSVLAVSLIILGFSACTFHIPYEVEDGYYTYHIRLEITPDDADVLLNGRFIGAAYEFSTPATAIRLASRRNELIIKKDGYVEEAINLYEYGTRQITIRRVLKQDDESVQEDMPEEKPEYTPIPRTVKEKEVPPMPVEPVEERAGEARVINITLDIEPPESAIYLDGKFWGISPRMGKIENLRLRPGRYLLEVVKPGYRPYKKELRIGESEDVNLTIKLNK